MNVDITVRLDLSPALESALLAVARALSGGVAPLKPYDADVRNGICRKVWDKLSERGGLPTSQPGEAPEERHSETIPAERPTKASKPSPWTEERNEIVRFYVAAGQSVDDILPRVNACEGPEVSKEQLRSIIAYRKLRRDPQPPPSPAKTPAPTLAPASPPPAPARVFPPVGRTDSDGAVVTDDATIRQWAAQRGLCNGGAKLDLAVINAKRIDLGLPPYARVTLQHSGATMRPSGTGAGR